MLLRHCALLSDRQLAAPRSLVSTSLSHLCRCNSARRSWRTAHGRQRHSISMALWTLFGRRKPTESKLQTLWDDAKAFANHPSNEAAMRVQQTLAQVPLEELGLAAEARRLDAEGCTTSSDAQGAGGAANQMPPISYMHIREDRSLSMGIFALAAGASLPLHNHPGMHVFSRVLYGSMHVRSFDWADERQRVAQLAADQVMTGGDDPSMLGPRSGGNVHQFTAVTDTAVLDVLTPPYAPSGGRDCTYYSETQWDAGTACAVLQEYDPGAHFVVKRRSYHGMRPAGS